MSVLPTARRAVVRSSASSLPKRPSRRRHLAFVGVAETHLVATLLRE